MGPKRAKPIAIMVALGVALPCLLLSRGSPSAADTASRVGLAGTHAPPLFDASYGYLTRKDGTWTYPDLRLRNGQIAPDGGLTPDVVIPKIEDSGSHFVKVGRESAPDPEVAPYYDELHNQTPPLELGVRLNVRPEPSRRTLPDLLKRARHLRRSPTGCTPAPSASPCYYDWIFLDGAMLRSTKGLQRLIRGLRSNGPDGGGGWRLIMTNDTGWPGQGTKLARGEWAHAHSLGILHKPWDRRRKRHVTAIIRHHPRRVITDSDQEFIHEVRKRDPGSRPVLKFEVHTGTDKLQRLPRRIQIRLLRELDHAQRGHHFKLIYPLFVGFAGGDRKEHCGGRTACNSYNSLRDSPSFARKLKGQGTYLAQRRLMLSDGTP